MVITWLDFGEVLLETVILANFLYKFRMCFCKVKHYFGHISGMVGPIDVKRKGSAMVGYWIQCVTLTFDLTHDLDLGCFKVKFRNSCISGIVGLIDVKWKGSELTWYWADYITLPFDHTHDLDLGVSRSESEIALSQEWGGRLTWKEKDLSHPFMTMILTSVTMVGWADVPDSDRGDFRRRWANNSIAKALELRHSYTSPSDWLVTYSDLAHLIQQWHTALPSARLCTSTLHHLWPVSGVVPSISFFISGSLGLFESWGT